MRGLPNFFLRQYHQSIPPIFSAIVLSKFALYHIIGNIEIFPIEIFSPYGAYDGIYQLQSRNILILLPYAKINYGIHNVGGPQESGSADFEI